MHDTILVRYGEIALKGKNRTDFEKKLVANIRSCLKKNNVCFRNILRKRGRILIETGDSCRELSRVFGIVSFSHAKKTGTDPESIKKAIYSILSGKKFRTFRVSSNRADKSTGMNSQEMNVHFGSYIAETFRKKVSLKDFDVDVGIEIIDGSVYVFIDSIEGPKGLPCGVNGIAIALIKDRKSLLATWLMMRRGLRVIPVGTKAADISLLQRYNYGSRELEFLRLNDLSELNAIAEKREIFTLVTGDTLKDINDYPSGLLVLRPLVGFSIRAIEGRLKNI
jgi:thiamine biosynthesis protein ThiI